MSRLTTNEQKIAEYIGGLQSKNERLEKENKTLKAEIVRLKAALEAEITKAKTPDTTNKRKPKKQTDTDDKTLYNMYAHRGEH